MLYKIISLLLEVVTGVLVGGIDLSPLVLLLLQIASIALGHLQGVALL